MPDSTDIQPEDLKALVRNFAVDDVKSCFPNVEPRRAAGTLYARLLQDLGESAARSAKNVYIDDFRWTYFDPISNFVSTLHSSVSDFGSQEPNFWKHDQFAIEKAKRFEGPEIHRDLVENVVADYLALPVRSALVDRTLVDILLATELFAFASEVFSGNRVSIAKGNGPLDFLFGRLFSILFFSGPIVIAVGVTNLGWLTNEWSIGVIWGLIGLFLIETAWASLRFPFAWRAQVRQNAHIAKLLSSINSVYAEMNSTGPISAKHIRDRAQAASFDGVGWPPSLFVLLDDIVARGGRI